MDKKKLKEIIKVLIFSTSESTSLEALCQTFEDDSTVGETDIQEALGLLLEEKDPLFELKNVAGGYQYHIQKEYHPWIQKQLNRKSGSEIEPYSKAFVETLAIIAYKQPVSRGEVDTIRGKSSAYSIFEELIERKWIKIVAYDEEQRGAALYGTTKTFLEYFGLNSIRDLPELSDLEEMLLQESATTL